MKKPGLRAGSMAHHVLKRLLRNRLGRSKDNLPPAAPLRLCERRKAIHIGGLSPSAARPEGFAPLAKAEQLSKESTDPVQPT